MSTFSLFLSNEAATLHFAAALGSVIRSGPAILFLHGQLGAGKTTLTRGIVQSLGYEGPVKSPTYTLVESYQFSQTSLFHFDLYRLQDPDELAFIGIHDYFHPKAICIIEWPERGDTWLPLPDLSCFIRLCENGRDITLTTSSKRGEAFLEQLLCVFKN